MHLRRVPRELRIAPELEHQLRSRPVCRRYALLLNPFYAKDPHASFGKHVLTPSLALTSIAGAGLTLGGILPDAVAASASSPARHVIGVCRRACGRGQRGDVAARAAVTDESGVAARAAVISAAAVAEQ